MRPTRLVVLLALAAVPLISVSAPSRASGAEGPFKAEVLKEAPPDAFSAAIRAELATQGYRVVDAQGKPYADIWLRKATPASGKPAGVAGTVQFPTLGSGVLLGGIRFAGDGQDYRDQTIAKGAYTLRYGLQPQNGAHLGVSPFRDYAMMLPSAKDTTTADLAAGPLNERSAEAAGTSHPGILMLLAAAEPAKAGEPAMAEDKEKATWALVVPIPLAVKGDAAPAALDVQIIVSGAAMP